MPEPSTANRQIARAAGTVMAAFVLSNVTGLVRQVLVSRAFGTQVEIDAFYAASQLPDLLFNLIAGGALASAFLPTFTGFLTKDDRPGAWQLASAVVNWISLLLAFTSALAALFAPQLIRGILAPGLPAASQALAADLLRIRLLAPVVFGVSGLLMGVLNAHQKFLLPALAPTMYWLGMIFGVLCLGPYWGIYGLAWGAVLGAVLHLIIQLPGLARLGWKYTLILGLKLPAVRQVGLLMAPRLMGVSAVQLYLVVNTILATYQPEGSLTALNVAWMILTMPQVVIAQAIAIAAMPTFSAQAARGELKEMRTSLAATLRGVLLLSLPATLGLIMLRQPLVGMLFQYGEFDIHSTGLVAWALLWYAVGLVGHSVVEIMARSFYALNDTKTPVLMVSVAMGLNVILSLALAALFTRLGWMPHGGLALANSLATALEMTGLIVVMRRRLNGLQGQTVLAAVLQGGAATLLMVLGLAAWLALTAGGSNLLVAGGGIMLGGGLYVLGLLVLGVNEAHQAWHTITRR